MEKSFRSFLNEIYKSDMINNWVIYPLLTVFSAYTVYKVSFRLHHDYYSISGSCDMHDKNQLIQEEKIKDKVDQPKTKLVKNILTKTKKHKATKKMNQKPKNKKVSIDHEDDEQYMIDELEKHYKNRLETDEMEPGPMCPFTEMILEEKKKKEQKDALKKCPYDPKEQPQEIQLPANVEDLAMKLLKNSNSLNQEFEDTNLSAEERTEENAARDVHLKKMFHMLEENDTTFTVRDSIEPIHEDIEDYRFKVLEENGDYKETDLKGTFENQLKLYGL